MASAPEVLQIPPHPVRNVQGILALHLQASSRLTQRVQTGQHVYAVSGGVSQVRQQVFRESTHNHSASP